MAQRYQAHTSASASPMPERRSPLLQKPTPTAASSRLPTTPAPELVRRETGAVPVSGDNRHSANSETEK
ncbi:hypothetical protein BT67DRAFT_445147 [Trichocladium antarcticum]|uniref:Uncharacterized protein n=1 Tax=Trichocladium antarcticum TaxID=1450529 RepID=A0AAN6UDF7_9PEZI|nr:hypothetical protein BT67DRAFT_445147 [Trichocladium antarcticum]